MNQRQCPSLVSRAGKQRALNWLLFLSLIAPLVGAWLPASVAHADGGSGNWRHLNTSTEPGLLSNNVHAITFERGPDGIPWLWVGTNQGLLRFDGRDWEQVWPNPDTVTQAAAGTSDVWAIAHDDQGNLWISTGTGLQRRDREGQWQTWPAGDGGAPGEARVIAPLNDGRVLVATGSALYLGPPETSQAEWYTLDPGRGDIHDVLVSDGDIWLATQQGAVRLNLQSPNRQPDPLAHPASDHLSDDAHALALHQGRLWIGRGNGLSGVLLDSPDDPASWTVFESGQPGLANATVNDLLVDDDGNLWVATDGGGLSVYDGERWSRYFQARDGLLSDRVRQLLLDDQGTLWAVTDGGVSGLDHTWHPFTPATTTSPDVIAAHDVRALWGDGKGNVWVGTYGGGVSLGGGGDGNWTTFTSANSGLTDDRVLSLTGDGQGNLWIGTESGLFRRVGDQAKGLVTPVHSSLPSVPIYALWCDNPSKIWVGSQSGLFESVGDPGDPASLTWKRHGDSLATDAQPSGSPIPTFAVQALWGDGDAELWVGTNRGLQHISGDQSAEFTVTDLPDNDVRALWGDAQGRLWAGTGRGLRYINLAQDEAWTFVSGENASGAVPTGVINALWVDDRGQIWVSSENGLAVSQDGQSWRTARTGAVRTIWGDERGHVWVGGPNKLEHRPGWSAGWQDDLTDYASLRSPLVFDLQYDSATNTLWAATPAGLASTQDGGITWKTDPVLKGARTIHLTAQSTLWVGGSTNVARDRQDGTEWRRFDLPRGVEQVNAIWVGERENTIWFGANRALYRSNDDGATWEPITTTARLQGSRISALAGQRNSLWVGTSGGALAHSDDGGEDWQDVDIVAAETIYDLWSKRENDRESVMVATDRGLYRSNDGGDKWDLISVADGLPENAVTTIYVTADGDIWLGTQNSGLVLSNDQGGTWRVFNTTQGLPVIWAVTSGANGTLWAATERGLVRYAPHKEIQPWVRLLWVSDGQETFNQPEKELHLSSDQQLDPKFVGGSLIAHPDTVYYRVELISKDDPGLSFDPQIGNPAGVGSFAGVSFAASENERLDGDYTLSIVALDQDGRASDPRTLKIIGTGTQLGKFVRRLVRTVLSVLGTLLLIAILVGAAGWAVIWSLARSIGIPRRVLLRQRARIPFVTLGYRGYRHRWETATPLERLLVLLAPYDRAFTQVEAASWLQEHAIPCEEETLGRALQAAVRNDLLRREGYFYSLAERALNRALQDHEAQAGLETLMREVRDTHPLVAEAHNLFTAAGFALLEVEEPLSFLCQPAISFWTRRFEKLIYTRVLPGLSLDGQLVHALHHDASHTPEAGPLVFVIIDIHPADSGWDAIGELRAAGWSIIPLDDRLIQSWQAEKREQHNLAEHLDRFLDPDYDPYLTLPSASGALGYFGHTELAQKLLKRLEQGHATALIGLRKMGTSSTLRYLQDQTRWPTAIVDLQADPDLPTILTNALQEWQRSAARKLDLDLKMPERLSVINGSGDTAADFASVVGRFVRQLRTSTREPWARLVFLLDEIELIMPKHDGGGLNLKRYLALTRLLKGLVQDGLLALIVAGSDPQFNRTSLWGEHANPLYQLFQEQFLPPLNPEECSHMVRNIGRQVGLTYDQETLDFIAQASGGHPYLARQLCSLAYQTLDRAGAVPLDVLRQAAERFVRNPRTAAFLDDNGLWGYLGQSDLWGLLPGRANQAVLIDLAAASLPLTAQELVDGPNPDLRASAIYSLREQWVIRPTQPPTSPLRYQISFGLFCDWIALNRDKESPKLQLQQNAQEFLSNSNFNIKPLEGQGYTPWDFLSVPTGSGWRARFEHPVYTAIVAGQPLDDQAVLSIREAALVHSSGSGVAFAVIDERPDDAAWLQIATLRARGFSLVLLPQTLLQDGRASQKERRLLQNHLNRTLGRGHNPYDVRSPVYDVLNFFGRQALADQMTARLVAAQPLALFGLRKMGKSSMLYYLRNHVPFPVALVDLQSETELRAIYHEILRGWSRSLYIKFDFEWPVPILPETESARDLPAVFRDITANLLETLAQLMPAPKLGIFLDEIEQIVPNPDELEKLHQYLAFMRGVRGIIQESKQLALLVAGVDPALNRISRYGDEQNPAYQLFQEIFLPPLTPEDNGQMVRNIGRQIGLRFPQTAIDVINEASGGHPFLARQLCGRAYNELERAGQITAPALQETVDTFIRNPQSAANLNENGMWGEVTQPALWEPAIARANQHILKQLAAADEPLKLEQIFAQDENEALEDAFYALQNRWIINKIKQRRGRTVYQITFGLFCRWIRRRFELDKSQDI